MGIYRKRSDALLRANQSICFPRGTAWIVYSAALTSPPLAAPPSSKSHFCFPLPVQHADVKSRRSFWFFFMLFLSPKNKFPVLPYHLRPSSSSSSPAHQPSHGPSERRPSPPGAAHVGARQRRPLPRALLHRAAEGASREQLDSSLRLCQPRGHLLRSIQVECTCQVTASGCRSGWIFILFIGTNALMCVRSLVLKYSLCCSVAGKSPASLLHSGT